MNSFCFHRASAFTDDLFAFPYSFLRLLSILVFSLPRCCCLNLASQSPLFGGKLRQFSRLRLDKAAAPSGGPAVLAPGSPQASACLPLSLAPPASHDSMPRLLGFPCAEFLSRIVLFWAAVGRLGPDFFEHCGRAFLVVPAPSRYRVACPVCPSPGCPGPSAIPAPGLSR